MPPKTPSYSPSSSPWPSRLERWARILLGAVLAGLPLFFWISSHDQFELPKLTLLRLVSVALIGCWLAIQALSPSWRWRRSPIDLPLLLWSLWLIVKTLNSVSPSVSWRGEYENFAGSLTQLNYSLLFFLAVQFAPSRDNAKRLLLVFELGCAAVAMYAVFQALGLDFVAWASNSVVSDRFFASMGNPNFLGALMIMGLALAIGRLLDRGSGISRAGIWGHWALLAGLPLLWLGFYLFYPPGHRFDLALVLKSGQRGAQVLIVMYISALALVALLIKSQRWRLALDAAILTEAVLLFKALSDTGTRGAFAGLLATLGFLAAVLLQRQWRKMAQRGRGLARRSAVIGGALAALFAGLTLASFAMGPTLRQRMFETLSHPLHAFDASRLNIWGPALSIAKDYPLTGTGVDTFKTVFPQYSYSRFAHYDGENVASRMAHCEPLQVLSTMGIIGLGLWFWLCGAWALAWVRRFSTEDEGQSAWLLGLGGFFTGYLVQNLVSFGVSAISAPFFLCMGLLWSGTELPEWRKALPSLKAPLLLACLAWLPAGAWLATTSFRADHLYNFGYLVSAQNQLLDRSNVTDCRNAAQYGLSELEHFKAAMGPEHKQEMDFWWQQLSSREGSLPKNEAEERAAQPIYSRAAKSLLMLLSILKQEEAVRLCPSEVKYHVYLGLAYEELYKLSALPELREAWFKRAEAAYAHGSAMNPRNAYYHGNLGRLYSLKAEEGQASYVALSEKNYFDAVALAPSTKLFYENLLLLYAQNGMGPEALQLLRPLEARERDLAGQLYLSEGTTFYQWSQNLKDAKGVKEKKAAMLKTALAALAKAQELSPENADVPYITGAIYSNENNRKLARAYMLKALAIKPDHDLARKFMQANKI